MTDEEFDRDFPNFDPASDPELSLDAIPAPARLIAMQRMSRHRLELITHDTAYSSEMRVLATRACEAADSGGVVDFLRRTLTDLYEEITNGDTGLDAVNPDRMRGILFVVMMATFQTSGLPLKLQDALDLYPWTDVSTPEIQIFRLASVVGCVMSQLEHTG